MSAFKKEYQNMSSLVTKSNFLMARLIPLVDATLNIVDMVKLKLESPSEASTLKKKLKGKEVIDVELASKKQKSKGTSGAVEGFMKDAYKSSRKGHNSPPANIQVYRDGITAGFNDRISYTKCKIV